MTGARIVHVMRSPVVGGSELETLAITRLLRRWRHEVVFPSVFAGWQPSIAPEFPPDVPLRAVPDPEAWIHADPPDLVHVQFPFLIHPEAPHLDSVLVFRGLPGTPPAPVVFTVHAAVNVPVVPDIHYLFHTEELYGRFRGGISPERATICPSLVELPASVPPRTVRSGGDVRILWVSRNEDAKFHPDLGHVCAAVRESCPDVRFRFIGVPETWRLPETAWSASEPCPAPDLAGAWRDADIFWYYPAPHLEETWCRTVTEAMSWGLPCVVAGHGAMRRQVRSGIEGLVVDDLDGCRDALVGLVRSPGTRARFGRAAQARAGALHREALGTLDALYERLTGSPPGDRRRTDAAARNG